MLCRPCWNNIAQEYCLVNVVQICLRQHCTRKLLAQYWLKAHRYTFAEKPAVSNMSDSLVLTRNYITEQSWLFLFCSIQCQRLMQSWSRHFTETEVKIAWVSATLHGSLKFLLFQIASDKTFDRLLSRILCCCFSFSFSRFSQ